MYIFPAVTETYFPHLQGKLRLNYNDDWKLMPDSDTFWEFYWEVRLQSMETLGKREAILAASRLLRGLAEKPNLPLRLLELGCGEGQIIGTLAEGHAQSPGINSSVGIDYMRPSLERARRDYPGLRFIEGDFTDPQLLGDLGEFALVLLVNALHEVYSDTYSDVLKEVDVPLAKQRVNQAFDLAAERLSPGGCLLLFDGLEPPGDPHEKLIIRFLSDTARQHFDTFVREYKPFRVAYREAGSPYRVELSRRDFTRYIDKSIFLGKALWKTERLESYQYFTEREFRAAFERKGLTIRELRALTVNDEKWSRTVEIETSGFDFPVEHIMIIAQK